MSHNCETINNFPSEGTIFSYLSHDVLILIASKLQIKDFVNFYQTCSSAIILNDNPTVWKKILSASHNNEIISILKWKQSPAEYIREKMLEKVLSYNKFGVHIWKKCCTDFIKPRVKFRSLIIKIREYLNIDGNKEFPDWLELLCYWLRNECNKQRTCHSIFDVNLNEHVIFVTATQEYINLETFVLACKLFF